MIIQKEFKTSADNMFEENLNTWSMRSSNLARTYNSLGGMGNGAVSAGDEGLETDAAAAEQAATAADNRLFSVCRRLCKACHSNS